MNDAPNPMSGPAAPGAGGDPDGHRPAAGKTSAWGRLRQVLLRPSARYSLLGLLTVGFFAGIIFWGGFNTGMEATNTLEFCTACHEMRDNVYQEYKQTVHYSNRTGVRAICSDCHVPHDWTAKVIRKIQASKELWEASEKVPRNVLSLSLRK